MNVAEEFDCQELVFTPWAPFWGQFFLTGFKCWDGFVMEMGS